jgi:hypothetical protein
MRKVVLTLDSVVQRNPKLVASQMDGEVVMMSIDDGAYYGLDEIGSRIWELMEIPVKVNSILVSLLEEFEVEKEECVTDTLEFLNDLMDKNLLLVKE